MMDEEAVATLRLGVRNGIANYSAWQPADFLPDNVGTSAELMLTTAASAFIAGVEEERAEELLRKAHAWLLDSTARDEQVGEHPVFFAMTRARALGLSAWLLGEESDERFRQAVRLHQQYLTEQRPDPELLEGHLGELVRDCLAADRPALGAEVYRRLVGQLPGSPAEIRTPLELAGWLCARLSAWHPPVDWLSVGKRVLERLLARELERGRAREAALWLKLVYSDSGAALTATEALRRGGELVGALPGDHLARLVLESAGDPVDIDLFTGLLVSIVAQARPGGTIEVRLADAPTVVVPDVSDGGLSPAEETAELDRAVAAALRMPYEGELGERLAAAVRGRLVAVDGQTPLTLEAIHLG
jgi:hypothetical protein